MNIWRRGPLDMNPYWRTAFRVARVPREMTRRKSIVQTIAQTRRLAKDEGAHQICGQAVSQAEINAAEQVLLDPRQRVSEELLEHASERFSADRIAALSREVAEALAGNPLAPLGIVNPDWLREWSKALTREYIETQALPDPSFGALELDLAPPFGTREES